MNDNFEIRVGKDSLLKIGPGTGGKISVRFACPLEGARGYFVESAELSRADAARAAVAMLGGGYLVQYKFSVGDTVYFLDRTTKESYIVAVRILVDNRSEEVRYLLQDGGRQWSWKFAGKPKLYRQREVFASKEELKRLL